MPSANTPLALYIHYPWCVRKCPYCDFNSHPEREAFDGDDYIDALILDLEQELPSIWGRSISSIFIGGGTPSLMTPQQLDHLLAAIRARVSLIGSCEITLEANPGTFEQQRFKAYRQSGVNRLSIGVQSFNDDHLQSLERIHNRHEAMQAFEMARAAGFENINLDLMFGLPGQNVKQALDDLHQAIALQPEHISWYQLTIEPNTPFSARPPELPNEDQLWEQANKGVALLGDAGYQRYEISAYSRPGMACRHNMNYWQFGDYVGIGAGAHQKLTRLDQNAIIRTQKKRHPKAYLAGVKNGTHLEHRAELSMSDQLLEFMMNALRLKSGFEPTLLTQRTDCSIDKLKPILNRCVELGLLSCDENRIAATEQGYRYLDSLLEHFVGE